MSTRPCSKYGCACRGHRSYCVAPDEVSDAEADRIADDLIGPVLSTPVQAAFGPRPNVPRAAFLDALDRVRHGCSVRAAVEDIAVHYQLSEAEQEQLVDDVDEDVRMFGGGR